MWNYNPLQRRQCNRAHRTDYSRCNNLYEEDQSHIQEHLHTLLCQVLHLRTVLLFADHSHDGQIYLHHKLQSSHHIDPVT